MAKHTFYLAWRYITGHKLKTAILVACLTLTVYLPLAANLLLARFQEDWESRAAETPLIIGAKGSRFDLVLHGLYFRADLPDRLSMSDYREIRSYGYGEIIPIYFQHHAEGFPIVGAPLDYFEFRGLKIANGLPLTMLGDCLLGADVARSLDLGPGDSLISEPENVFDIAGNYPLKMRIAGVLAPTGTPDDEAIFVDLKTAWIIEGLAHGHQDVANEADEEMILSREDGNIIANAALQEYTEITRENISSFHFHAEEDDLPVTAIIASPHDDRGAALLRGKFVGPRATSQILIPEDVVAELMETVIRAKRLFDTVFVFILIAVILFLTLVITLSIRLREVEIRTLNHLGCSRFTVFRLVAAEFLIVIVLSAAAAGALAFGTLAFAGDIFDLLIG